MQYLQDLQTLISETNVRFPLVNSNNILFIQIGFKTIIFHEDIFNCIKNQEISSKFISGKSDINYGHKIYLRN